MVAKRTYPPFRFKQFTVSHDRSAMKLGVDAVLLSCWLPENNYQNALDVGAGCGIISLVMAQRFPQCQIQAVEIEPNAFEEASLNFKNSPWSDRLTIHHQSFEAFLKKNATDLDLIISNPPYFLESKTSQSESRTKARHATDFDFEQFFKLSAAGSIDSATLAMVFPNDQSTFLIDHGKAAGWYLKKHTEVYPMPHKKIKRGLFLFTKQAGQEVVRDSLILELERGVYTKEYSELVKDFYLHF